MTTIFRRSLVGLAAVAALTRRAGLRRDADLQGDAERHEPGAARDEQVAQAPCTATYDTSSQETHLDGEL